MPNLAATVITGRPSAAVETKASAIRRAAYLCFAKHGYHGTTVDLVCAEAGISKGAFYWHYDSKQSVFLAILDTWAEEVERELDSQFATALQASGAATTDFAPAIRREAHRVRAILPVWLEFIAQAGRNAEMRSAIDNFHRRIRDVISRLITPSLGPSFDEGETRVIASILLGAFIGTVGQQLHELEAGFDQHVENVLAVLKRLIPNQKQA
jgi:AcrR family transcriptional regulator